MKTTRVQISAALLVAGLVVTGSLLWPSARAGDADAGALPARPRLVVLISIDQFRADCLTRYADLFTSTKSGGAPRGFRYLMEKGAWYSDAHHDHFRLFTGPGHSVLVTGAQPATSGIVGNDWADRVTGEKIYCVRDDASPLVGATGTGISPRSLRVSTVGDELKIATGGRAKVWGLAFKDRAAVLMGGHVADGAVWLDPKQGKWISSRRYFKDGVLPAWTEATSPKSMWTAEKWTTDVPDLLAINLSSNDYLGHAFGPDSPEVLAMTVETDRCLADFMEDTVRKIPGGWSAVTFVVTADHGVAPIPEAMKDAGFDAGRYDEGALEKAIATALGDRMRADPQATAASWSFRIVEDNVYLNHARLAGPAEEAEAIAADVLRATPGIAAAFTRSDILRGRLPPTDLAARVAKGFNGRVSGDVVFVSEPFWLPVDAKYATSHGTTYAYDTSVPIFFAGCGVREPGRHRGRVSTLDIAATLADELGVLQPSGCEGRCLPHAGR